MASEELTMDYTEIKWDYSKKKNPLSDKSKYQLRQMGMTANGISQLSTAKSITNQKDMQILTALVSKALG